MKSNERRQKNVNEEVSPERGASLFIAPELDLFSARQYFLDAPSFFHGSSMRTQTRFATRRRLIRSWHSHCEHFCRQSLLIIHPAVLSRSERLAGIWRTV